MSSKLDPAEQQEFHSLQIEGKRLAAEGKLKASLKKFMLAMKIYPTQKIQQRIEKLKEHMKISGINISNNDSVNNISSKDSMTSSSQSSIEAIPDKSNVLSDIQNLEKSKLSSKLTPQNELEFKRLKERAKELSYEGRYEEALVYFKNSLLIYNCPKVQRYIGEVKKALGESYLEVTKSQTSSVEGKHFESSSSVTDVFATKNVLQEGCSDVTKNQTLPVEEKYSDSSEVGVFMQKSNVTDSNSSAPDEKNKIEQVKDLYYEARDLAQDGNLKAALQLLKKAQAIQPTAKVKKQIDKIESITADSNSSIPNDDDENRLKQVKELYYEAQSLASAQKLKDALKLLKRAQAILETERVQKLIDKIEGLLEKDSDSEGDKMIKIADDFAIFHEIYKKLYPYQREGVAWMWSLYKKGKGGVLGDDMGLGKTFEVIAFLSGMIDADHVNHVIIIMPVSLIANWEKEFQKWSPGISVQSFHGTSKKDRERKLLKVQRRGHVLLTSYGMLVNNIDLLTHVEGQRFIWDYVILDEGHKIKNPTKTTKAVHDISAKNRLILTGTPIQNNLRELWSLYDFAHHGTLLGTLKTFKLQYENPITRAREKDATAGEKHLGTEMSQNLKSLIQPYFLRRSKEEIWGKKDDELDELGNKIEGLKLTSRKNDLIVWTYMTEPQIEIYQSFLHSDAVKSILVSKRSPLVELTILKKICDHPRLLSKRACLQLGLNGQLNEEELLLEMDDESNMASSIENVSDETLLLESGKLDVVLKLLHSLRDEGHRILVFSLSRKILDMLHRILVNRKWKVLRLDGTISKMEERHIRIQRFQKDPSIPVFLITTQVGGVGITLTAADRVIIYDPSWNPATDAQAVDRVYRIGQQKNVIIYRLITCGTVEEKIYRRQIFKDSITRQTTGAADPYRYFSKQELRELFSLDNAKHSATQVQLSKMHASERNTDKELDNHIKYLETLNIFGISDHDLMFSRQIQDQTEDNDEAAVSHEYIKKQVAMANELIQREASVVAEGLRITGDYHRPYQEVIPLPKKSTAKDSYKPPVIPDIVDLTEDAREFKARSLFPTPEVITIDEPEFVNNHRKSDRDSAISKAEGHSTAEKNKDSDDIIQQYLSFYDSAKKTKPKENGEIVEDSLDSTYQTADEEDIAIKNAAKEIGGLPRKSGGDSNLNIQGDMDYVEVEGPLAGNSLHETKDSSVKLANASNMLMSAYLQDLSLDNDVHDQSVRLKRKSCARKSDLLVSDNSNQSSCPPSLNSTNNLVKESDDSDSEDSSNSGSVSYIQESVPSTPLVNSETRVHQQSHHSAVNSTPIRSNNSSYSMNYSDSVRRITPLKVSRSSRNFNSPFAKALAASPILTPKNSPEASTSITNVSHVSVADSPIKTYRKRRNVIQSDSEESDESDNNVDDFSGDESPIKELRKKEIVSSVESDSEPHKENNVSTEQASSTSLPNISHVTDKNLITMSRRRADFIETDSEESSAEADGDVPVVSASPSSFANVSHKTSIHNSIKTKTKMIQSDSNESESQTEVDQDINGAAKRLLSPSSNVSLTYTKSPIKKRQKPNITGPLESDNEIENGVQDKTDIENSKFEHSQTLFSEDESEESDISSNELISEDDFYENTSNSSDLSE